MQNSTKNKSPGQIAYEAYCKYTDNKSLISGAELPTWENLNPTIKNAWESAASAVLSTLLNALGEEFILVAKDV